MIINVTLFLIIPSCFFLFDFVEYVFQFCFVFCFIFCLSEEPVVSIYIILFVDYILIRSVFYFLLHSHFDIFVFVACFFFSRPRRGIDIV